MNEGLEESSGKSASPMLSCAIPEDHIGKGTEGGRGLRL